MRFLNPGQGEEFPIPCPQRNSYYTSFSLARGLHSPTPKRLNVEVNMHYYE